MKNREIFLKDPLQSELLNNGVAEVRDIQSHSELQTLRYELETFVCEGQYAAGLARILGSYLQNLDKPEQPAVWVGGFFGSGKSHLVKMLRSLWVDIEFPDKATARGIARLPTEITDLLRELSTAGKRYGGLHAAAGTLSAGAGESVRLALLSIVFRSVGLPEKYPIARFVIWLKRQGIYAQVKQEVEAVGKPFDRELLELYVSPLIASALLTADPTFAPNPAEARLLIRTQYPNVNDISLQEMVDAISDALSVNGHFPCTLVVLDEVQQYIGDNADRTLKVQEVTEACVKKFGGRLLFVGTGQSALSSTPQLQKLQGRFRLAVQLSDTDVETVIRQVVLAKKPDKVPSIHDMLAASSGEISRHLVGTRIEPRSEDQEHDVADYPLLPVRSRFWECVLRAVDQAGTAGQLRNQLKIVHEAVKQIADAPFGTVVAGDFIYDQIATDLLQTGVLLSEIHELIQKQRSGAPEGELRARLCALIFLIGKLPKKNGADIGLRATPEALADLLVQDLKAGGAQLRMHIPELLRGLVETGSLLQVDNEYRLQTRENSAWETDWRNRLATILHDDARLASERADLLRVACGERIKNVRLQHGKSREARHLELCFTRQAPEPAGQVIPVWVRDGWNDDEKSVLADARKAGTDSPMISVFIPRRNSDELKQAIASVRAAEETLQVRGIPTTPAGLEARQAMDTRKLTAERTLRAVVGEVLSGARVFLAGGSEYTGADLNTVVLDAAQHALTRLYPHFDLADDPRWDKVIERARKGDGSALEVLGYHGDPGNHPVCSALFKEIGAGKKGRDLRRHFSNSPYGWPQDAIDGALLVLCMTEKVKATQDGKPIEIRQLDQTRIGVTEFRTEQTTVTTGQHLAIRRLFQEAGLDCKPQEESAVAGEFLRRMLALAESAGGEAPLPARPDSKHLHQLSSLTGNEQLVALYNERERLVGEVHAWQHAKALLQARRPRWEALHQLLDHARGLPVFADMHPQVMAIAEQRTLLAEPDPMPGLCEQLTQALRQALVAAYDAYKTDDDSHRSELTSSPIWQQLTPDQQAHILAENGLSAVPEVEVGTEAEVLQSLHATSLDAWRTRRDALRQRFEKARLAAAQLREPKAVRIELPSATLCTEQELDNWLAAVRQAIMQGLQQGPVLI